MPGGARKRMESTVEVDYNRSTTCCEFLLTLGAWILVIILPPLWCQLTRQVNDYERAVIFRLGKLSGGPQGPGLFMINPLIDVIRVVDLRVVSVKSLLLSQTLTKTRVAQPE